MSLNELTIQDGILWGSIVIGYLVFVRLIRIFLHVITKRDYKKKAWVRVTRKHNEKKPPIYKVSKNYGMFQIDKYTIITFENPRVFYSLLNLIFLWPILIKRYDYCKTDSIILKHKTESELKGIDFEPLFQKQAKEANAKKGILDDLNQDFCNKPPVPRKWEQGVSNFFSYLLLKYN